MDLGVSEQSVAFWKLIECSTKTQVASHIKNILHLAGYTTAITVKELKQDDIGELEEFARSIPALVDQFIADNNLKPKNEDIATVRQLFLGFFAKDATKFRFSTEDILIILRIAQFSQVNLNEGCRCSDCSHFCSGNNGTPIPTTNTVVGTIFASYEAVDNANFQHFEATCRAAVDNEFNNISHKSECFILHNYETKNVLDPAGSCEEIVSSSMMLLNDEIHIHDSEPVCEEEQTNYTPNDEIESKSTGNDIQCGVSENSKSKPREMDGFLKEMISCFNNNIQRVKQAYRYTDEVKQYATYTRIIGGRLSYETFEANALHAVPNIRSIDRYISKTKSSAMEGVLRTEELLQYLNDHNVPKVVSLSEDATRITSRIQYDTATNQLVGFVLPLNGENGMPIARTYLARSAAEIEGHFYDVKNGKEKTVAANVNVVMAQPLKRGIPPFCLLLFGTDSKYTSDNVAKRWDFITNELKKKNIEVATFSSDSDPKFNLAMRQKLKLAGNREETSNYPQWFNADRSNVNYCPIQDTIHIGTKFRNRLLNSTLQFGEFIISVDHLITLINTFPKNKHNLCMSNIHLKDRQNFDSVLRICDDKVINMLAKVNGSEGTVLYLRVVSSILRAFLDFRLKPLERVRLIWFPVFILRIWKAHIMSDKTFTMKNHFITTNCYHCVEINAHSLIILILYLKERNLDHLFLAEMLGSQQCESIFRQIRSLSSTYSTVTNSSLLEIIQKMAKIELLNDISHIKLQHFNFPRIGVQSSSYYPRVDRNGVDCYNRTEKLPSQDDIFKEVEMAKLEAIEYAASLGVHSNNFEDEYECKSNTVKSKKQKEKECVTTDEDNLVESNVDQELLKLFSEINLSDCNEKIDPDKINDNSPYVMVRNERGDLFCVKKHTLCWILGKSTSKLSSDRLRRVMSK